MGDVGGRLLLVAAIIVGEWIVVAGLDVSK
jgi:hypothetical protein